MIAISCAVRGGQLNLACGPFLVSYLHRGFGMSMRDVRLVQGVIFRTYFQQFEAADVAVPKMWPHELERFPAARRIAAPAKGSAMR